MGTISSLSRTVTQLLSTMSSSAPAPPPVTIQRPPPRQQRPQQNQSTPGGAQSDAPRYAHIPLNPAPDCCIFCGDEEHYVRDCHIVEKYIQQNKLARNASGKLVLPDGRYPPRSIPGILLRDRIDNYWKRLGQQPNDVNYIETPDSCMFTFEVAPLDDEYEDELYDDVQEMRDQIQRLSARVFAAEKGKGRQFDGVEPPQRVGFPG